MGGVSLSSLLFLLAVGFFLSYEVQTATSCPKNIILVIGDGMGRNQVRAAEMYLGREVSWKDAPYKASGVKTASTADITDSAASGTAMSTGVTVDNEVLSIRIPGNGSEIRTSLEYYSQNKRTGFVTSTYINHATPAAFASHESNRFNLQQIFEDYLVSKPNLMFGGGRPPPEVNITSAQSAGYKVATNKSAMNSFLPTDPYVMAVFGEDNMPYEYDESSLYTTNDWPHLHEMVGKALTLLSQNNPNGFFLMIECGRIDHAGHGNDINRNVFETKECDLMFQIVKDFTTQNTNTFTVVTSDHECGGLNIINDNGAGNIPTVIWGSVDHTSADIDLFAYGSWGSSIDNKDINNEEIFGLTFFDYFVCNPVPDPSPSISFTQSVSTSFVSVARTPNPSSTKTPTSTSMKTPSPSPNPSPSDGSSFSSFSSDSSFSSLSSFTSFSSRSSANKFCFSVVFFLLSLLL